MLFIHPYKAIWGKGGGGVLVFKKIKIYKLNILSAIQKMAIRELRDFIYENYYRRIGSPKESSYNSAKH